MTGQLLPLRLLTSSKLFLSSRGGLALRLNTLTFSSNSSAKICSIGDCSGRCFSTRAERPRNGGRSGFREGRAAAAGGQAKSLVEDEAELSDWVSDLKTDSFRFSLSDNDDEGPERDRKMSGRNERDDRVRSRDSGGFSGRSGRNERDDRVRGRDSGGVSGSSARNERDDRVRGRDSGGFSGSSGRNDRDDQVRGRDSGGFSGRSGRNERDDRVRGRDSGGFSGRRGSRSSGGISERSSRGSLANKRFDDDLEEGDRRVIRGSNGLTRNGRSSGFSERRQGSSLSKRRFGSDEDEDDEEKNEKKEFLSSRRGGRGSSSSFMKKGERIVESSYKEASGSLREMSEDDDEEEDDEDEDDVYGSDDDFIGNKRDNKGVSVKDPLLNGRTSTEVGGGHREKTMATSSTGDKDSYLSNTRFDQCSISSLTLKGVKAAGYERMTLVQEATLPVILKGKDVLAKARTGTGKTVAFLLPAIEIISKVPPVGHDQKRPPINVLVICPTRELADQAATEANTLLKFHPSIGVQVVIGGTRLALEQKRMQANPCQILVATPGRLRDHIENTPGFATRLMGVKVLVLDEADRLLDMGFRKDIEKIVAAVPKQRQTLLFSATVPDDVRQICYIAMKRDHEFVNTVEEGSEETHSQVSQMHLIVPLEKQFPILYGLLTDHIAEDVDYKVIVFCTTAMVTKLVADFLSELRLNVREIHSRKPQSYRTRVSKEFKESKGLILVSSDVSARGVDYPDVTLVIQVGVPADREQYIHRLGRTGRKGKEGQGILLLAPWEEFFLSSIKDLPMTKAAVPLVDPDTRKKVERALGHVEMKNKESAYQAWLGYYNSNKMIGRDKGKLVLLANEFSRSMGLDNPPAIAKLVLRKMGLNNVPGLRAK